MYHQCKDKKWIVRNWNLKQIIHMLSGKALNNKRASTSGSKNMVFSGINDLSSMNDTEVVDVDEYNEAQGVTR